MLEGWGPGEALDGEGFVGGRGWCLLGGGEREGGALAGGGVGEGTGTGTGALAGAGTWAGGWTGGGTGTKGGRVCCWGAGEDRMGGTGGVLKGRVAGAEVSGAEETGTEIGGFVVSEALRETFGPGGGTWEGEGKGTRGGTDEGAGGCWEGILGCEAASIIGVVV